MSKDQPGDGEIVGLIVNGKSVSITAKHLYIEDWKTLPEAIKFGYRMRALDKLTNGDLLRQVKL